MRATKTFHRILLSLGVLLASQSAVARDWFEYTSDHYLVYSDAPQDEAIEHIENFERIRSIALGLLGLSEPASTRREVIVFFGSLRGAGEISANSNLFFNPGGLTIFLRPDSDKHGELEQLYHSYVHHLMERHSASRYPPWFGEGFARFLSTLRAGATWMVIGELDPLMVNWGDRAAVADVIGRIHDEGTGFYSTSWLMVHYMLQDSTEGANTRRERLATYLQRFDAGDDPAEMFEEVFGMTPEDMERELGSYTRRVSASRLSDFRYSGALSRRALASDEALFRIGYLMAGIGRHDTALEYFEEFHASGGSSPFREMVMARQALSLLRLRRGQEGDELITALLGREISDPGVLADIACYASIRAIYGREADRPDLEHLKLSLTFGERAVSADPDNLNAHYCLGIAQELASDDEGAFKTLVDAYALDRAIVSLNLVLARVAMKTRQYDFAADIVSSFYFLSHSEKSRTALVQMQEDIKAGRADPAMLDTLLR